MKHEPHTIILTSSGSNKIKLCTSATLIRFKMGHVNKIKFVISRSFIM